MKKFTNRLCVLVFFFLTISLQSQTLPNIEFVNIPSGTFSMGEDQNDYEGPPDSYDAPVHTVTLSEFWMSKTEVTNLQYVDFLNEAYTAGLIEVKVETAIGPDKDKTLVFGSPTAPDEYKGFAILDLDGTRVMKDHNNSLDDDDPFTGEIEPENPLNICYIGFDDSRNDGDKFFVKDPASDFDWLELTNYYNYSDVTNQYDTSVLLNDFDNWPELADLPNNLPTLGEVKNWPATFIRWYGAKAFVMFYNLDLPTEAQWEYAASGGLQFKYATSNGNVNANGTSANWNWKDETPALHHVYDVYLNEPNPFGLYNMAGNVWEWCEDWYKSDFYVDATDPLCTDASANKKVRRGGSWNYHKSTLKSAARAEDEKFKGNDHFGFRVVSNSEITSVKSEFGSAPNSFELPQNYPNPFNPTTTIKYNIPIVGDANLSADKAGFASPTNVSIIVYDILGNEIVTLVNEQQVPGFYSVTFKANNLATGLYIYRISAGNNFIATKKMLLIK